MLKVPVISRRHKPGLRYRLGCWIIRAVGTLTDVPIDFEPLALPGDRVTGYVNCPDCRKSNLVTVSLFNKTVCACRHCHGTFVTMNDGTKIWILLKGEGDNEDAIFYSHQSRLIGGR